MGLYLLVFLIYIMLYMMQKLNAKASLIIMASSILCFLVFFLPLAVICAIYNILSYNLRPGSSPILKNLQKLAILFLYGVKPALKLGARAGSGTILVCTAAPQKCGHGKITLL